MMMNAMTVRAKNVPMITTVSGEREVKRELDVEATPATKLLGKLMMSMTKGAKSPST